MRQEKIWLRVERMLNTFAKCVGPAFGPISEIGDENKLLCIAQMIIIIITESKTKKHAFWTIVIYVSMWFSSCCCVDGWLLCIVYKLIINEPVDYAMWMPRSSYSSIVWLLSFVRIWNYRYNHTLTENTQFSSKLYHSFSVYLQCQSNLVEKNPFSIKFLRIQKPICAMSLKMVAFQTIVRPHQNVVWQALRDICFAMLHCSSMPIFCVLHFIYLSAAW